MNDTNRKTWNPHDDPRAPLDWPAVPDEGNRVVRVDADLFGDGTPFEFVDKVFAVMALLPQYQFQVLTKRPERMAEYLAHEDDTWSRDAWPEGMHFAMEALGWVSLEDRMTIGAPPGSTYAHDPSWPLPNLALGTSVEDQATADARIPHLLRCPAVVWLVECELVSAIVFADVPRFNLCGQAGIDLLKNLWVIVGGESGAGARPCDVGWIRSIIQQCGVAGVPVFVKQLGAMPRSWVQCRYWPCSKRRRCHICDGRGVEERWPTFNDHKGADMSEWPEAYAAMAEGGA